MVSGQEALSLLDQRIAEKEARSARLDEEIRNKQSEVMMQRSSGSGNVAGDLNAYIKENEALKGELQGLRDTILGMEKKFGDLMNESKINTQKSHKTQLMKDIRDSLYLNKDKYPTLMNVASNHVISGMADDIIDTEKRTGHAYPVERILALREEVFKDLGKKLVPSGPKSVITRDKETNESVMQAKVGDQESEEKVSAPAPSIERASEGPKQMGKPENVADFSEKPFSENDIFMESLTRSGIIEGG